MNELRGPNIQIVLHVKEGLGFGFLSSPFFVSGSLNGYTLETDPVIPSHSPSFDSELAWEADKKRFRNLRFQNVPVKVEVHTTASQGRKDKVGYLLLNLLSAQPCPSNRISNVKHTWHKLLGVKSEGKCCHPQLLLSLTIEDWINTPTPRNEVPMLHSNEIATYLPNLTTASVRPLSLTIEDYLAESKKRVTSADLVPRLVPEEGLIHIGRSQHRHLFILTFVIGCLENVDLIIPENIEAADCFVTYSVFTHSIQTDRYVIKSNGVLKKSIQFNHRTSLRLCTDLASLSRYFTECRHVITKLRCGDRDVGLCSADLRKLVPTEDVTSFITHFCNADKAIAIGERCFLLPCTDVPQATSRKPFVDIQISLSYVAKYRDRNTQSINPLSTRSASNLGCQMKEEENASAKSNLDKRKSSSCTEVNEEVSKYRLKETILIDGQNEIAEMIRKMYESFTISREKASIVSKKPLTSNECIQCDDLPADGSVEKIDLNQDDEEKKNAVNIEDNNNNFCEGKSVSMQALPKELAKLLPADEKEKLMKRCVEELEDWKEKQQEMFKYQLKQKEEYHLKMLSEEWDKRKAELESKLTKGIEMCRNLAEELTKASDDFTQRSYNVAQRERKLLLAKETLEQHYQKQYQELREASLKLEEDVQREARLKDMEINELRMENEHLRKELHAIKNSKSGEPRLTKQQVAGLIQELRNLEEKCDEASRSKVFFKEQWDRAVSELNTLKLRIERNALTTLTRHNAHIENVGLDDGGNEGPSGDKMCHKTSVSEPYLSDEPIMGIHLDDVADNLESDRESMRNSNLQKKHRLKDLMEQREEIVKRENPNEELLSKLNNEIKNILLATRT